MLIQLAASGLYRARWTAEINDEWVRNVLANRNDITSKMLEYTVTMMEKAIPGYNLTGYEDTIPGLTLTAKSDRHVLAAAIKCSAQVIVTYNLKHFPQHELAPYDVEAKHPDEFLQDCYDLAPPAVISGVKAILGRLKNPPVSAKELINTYRNKHQLAMMAASLNGVIDLLE